MSCPDLETLFAELAEGHGPALDHAKGCAACSAVLESHRQLEKDLYRLADPLPPADLVGQVMQRIAAEPAPRRGDIAVGLGILLGSIAGGLFAFFSHAGSLGRLGLGAAGLLDSTAAFASGMRAALVALWTHTGVPMAVVMFALLVPALYGLRKWAGASWTEAEA